MDDQDKSEKTKRRVWIACVVLIASGAFGYWSTEIVDWVNANWKFMTVLGVISGFTIGQVIKALVDLEVDQERRDVERRHLAAALLAEICVMDKEVCANILNIELWVDDNEPIPIDISESLRTQKGNVFEANLNRLGLFPSDLTKDLVSFHYGLETINHKVLAPFADSKDAIAVFDLRQAIRHLRGKHQDVDTIVVRLAAESGVAVPDITTLEQLRVTFAKNITEHETWLDDRKKSER